MNQHDTPSIGKDLRWLALHNLEIKNFNMKRKKQSKSISHCAIDENM